MSLQTFKVYVPDRVECYTFTGLDVEEISDVLLNEGVITDANVSTVEGDVIRYARPVGGNKGV